MNATATKSVRVAGIVMTALLIPVSILALFLLQQTGSMQQLALLLYIGWALINFIAMPFMLLGFIIRYTIKSVIYLAVAHLALSLANIALLLTSATLGSVTLLAAITLPSLLYIIGVIAHTKQQTEDRHKGTFDENHSHTQTNNLSSSQ